MSTRTNPFEELQRLLDRMSRQFEDAWESGDAPGWWPSSSGTMAVDLVEHDDEFVAMVDVPGFERDDIEATVTDHTLRITADREERVDESDERYLRRERRRESLHRSLVLPDEVDADRVTAKMDNGVLTVTLPRVETERARKIEVS